MLIGLDPIPIIILLALSMGLFLLIVYLAACIIRHVFRQK